jgi:hypothetical protein
MLNYQRVVLKPFWKSMGLIMGHKKVTWDLHGSPLSKRHPHHIRQKLWRVIITILDSQLPTAAKDARHSCERPSLYAGITSTNHAPSGINISIALTFT